MFFTGEYEKYAFSQIMLAEHSAQDKLNLYAEGMDKMVDNPELPKLFRDILRNTYIPYRDPDTLNRFLKEIAEFSYDDSEDLGNAFEYLLSIMGSQGDAGQFRTPRHIIDMMVEIVAPQKDETILDPACGTAGFLISAYNYIKKNNVDENSNSTLTPDDRNRMTDSFEGYETSVLDKSEATVNAISEIIAILLVFVALFGVVWTIYSVVRVFKRQKLEQMKRFSEDLQGALDCQKYAPSTILTDINEETKAVI